MSAGRVLLTGGCGLVGRVLAPMLVAEAYEVTHFEVSDPGDGRRWIEGDVRDSSAVAAACDGMDIVVHVAALHGRAWAEAGDDVGFAVNVVGTKNVLEGAVRAGVKRVVFTSSIWATGHGPNPPYLPIDEGLPREPAELYGLTKILGETMCRYATARHGMSTLVLRPGGIAPAAAYAPLQIGFLGGMVDVRDVARAHVLAVEAPATLRHDVFVITAASPLCELEPAAYLAEPVEMLEAVVPGFRAAVEAGTLPRGPVLEWYTVAKARELLGYNPRFNFTV